MTTGDNNLVLFDTTKKMQKYRIRRMYYSDIESVVSIEKTTWQNDSWSYDSFFQYLSNPLWYCWILESTNYDNSILGYGVQYIINTRSHIANLCIHPDERGRGWGGILLHYMIEHALNFGCSSVTLEVNTLNTAAHNLYFKYGFAITALLVDYYGHGSDGYEMKLSIK